MCAGALFTLSCSNAAREPAKASRAAARAPDKAALYGDPALIPTQVGERMREEAVLETAIVHALNAHPDVHASTAYVGLPKARLRCEAHVPERGHAVVTTRVQTNSTLTPDALATTVRAIVPAQTDVTVQLWREPKHEPAAPRPKRSLVFWLAVTALAASAGITLDRLISRARAR